MLQEKTRQDQVLLEAIKYMLSGWLDRSSDVKPMVREYHTVRNHLSVADGLLLYDNRIVIPTASRHDILEMVTTMVIRA